MYYLSKYLTNAQNVLILWLNIHINLPKTRKMKRIILVILFISFLLLGSGCKSVVDDVIDCSIESAFLSIHADIDENNPKLVHFEFVNTDADGGFVLDSDINWDFGDGVTATSTNHKTDHVYTNSGDFKVIATYVLRRGDASCNGPKDKTVTIE